MKGKTAMNRSSHRILDRQNWPSASTASEAAKRWPDRVIAAILICVCTITSACGGNRAARVFDSDDGRLIMRSSPEEITEGRALLETLPYGKIPRDMKGSIVFDGQVVSQLANDQHGQPAWLLTPYHVYVGAGELTSNNIIIASATVQDGGVALEMGREYRILAVNFDGRLYTWNGAVLELPSGSFRTSLRPAIRRHNIEGALARPNQVTGRNVADLRAAHHRLLNVTVSGASTVAAKS